MNTFFLRPCCLLAAGGVLPVLLTGCLALAAVPAVYTGLKLGQSHVKGSVKTSFEKPLVEEKAELASVRKLALWPETESRDSFVPAMLLTERLQNTRQFEVITPATVSRALVSAGLSASLRNLTAEEKIPVFRQVADATGAHAVFFGSPAEIKMNSSFLSASRASTAYRGTVAMYSRSRDALVWQEEAVVSVAIR